MCARLTPNPRNLAWWWCNPFVRLPGNDFLNVHRIDLFQSATLTLDDEEENK